MEHISRSQALAEAAAVARVNAAPGSAPASRLKRADIRVLKRSVSRDKGADAALQLLARSVQFRHGRLAAVRLDKAMEVGAKLPPDIVSYFASLPAKHRSAMLGVATHPFARMVLGELPASPAPRASRDAREFNERI